MKFRGLVSLLVLFSLGLISCSNNSSTTPPPLQGTGFLFVTTQGDNKVTAFKFDLADGKPTANGNGLDTGTLPVAAVLTPVGDALFVANKTSNDISRYKVGADGTLTSAGAVQTTVIAVNPTTNKGINPVSMAIDAAGKTLFVLTQGDLFPTPPAAAIPSVIEVFTVGSGGALTLQSATNTVDDSVAIAATPDGKFLYVANRTAGMVSGYAVGGTGTLTPVPGINFAARTAPSGLAVSPDGNFLYVANSGSDNVSIFAVCDNLSTSCPVVDGSLTEITASPVSVQTEPVSIAIMHGGKFLYVLNKGANQISEFSVAPVSGVITPTTPTATISTGSTPLSIAADTSGFYVYVANNGSSSITPLRETTNENTGDPTGVLTTAGGPVSTGGQPSAVAVK